MTWIAIIHHVESESATEVEGSRRDSVVASPNFISANRKVQKVEEEELRIFIVWCAEVTFLARSSSRFTMQEAVNLPSGLMHFRLNLAAAWVKFTTLRPNRAEDFQGGSNKHKGFG